MHRMISRLQTFLNRLCNHPLVFNSPALLNFFTEARLVNGSITGPTDQMNGEGFFWF